MFRETEGKVLKTKIYDKAYKTFIQSVLFSVLAIIMCAVSLTGLTWAWFSGDTTSSPNTIKSATCVIDAKVTQGENEITPSELGIYSFENNKEYTVTLTASGTASSGYCKIKIGSNTYYTDQISTDVQENSIQFKLLFSGDTKIELVKCWGIYRDEVRHINNGNEYVDMVRKTSSSGQ